MADLTPYSNTGDDTDDAASRRSPPGMPRWVKVFLIVLIALALLVLILLLVGGGHGPSRHM